ncbi:MAG: replication-associated recombination protein A [Leptospiraceae bacterium]|nr:replication-associated recombination protein A [Leptospiraceae bacterium]MCB1315728.1 replication-associated recombination protein A [Leptospiraceae bacterium]
MSDLFQQADAARGPLPARMRPSNRTEFVGQQSLRGRVFDRPLHSMILYGPPGCGKTTLAYILAREANREFHVLSAVSSGVKDVRQVIELGRRRFLNQGEGVVLFLDEIHRFSKTQQDSMLEAVEAGWVTLIGATTEHPSFEIVGPLLSRCRVYRLEALSIDELNTILERTLSTDLRLRAVSLEPEARELLLEGAAGDARKLLSFLELAAQHNAGSSRTTDGPRKSETEYVNSIDIEQAREILEGSLRRYDKSGENHYDFISAFIKSLRGSDPDAALLYMAAMLEAGEDPLFIARRMVIFAAEDVGNASPQALTIAVSAFQALERIGMPEGRIILAQAATFLASAPKSNAAYLAIDAAIAAIRNRGITIPNHLRNAPTRLHKSEGAGAGYQYPHDHPGHFVAAAYLPEGYTEQHFYQPSDQGQEARIRDRLASLWPERFK